MKFIIVFLFMMSSILHIECAIKLEKLNVDPSSITVSGLSAGGAMAMQFHFAFSREISGSGVVAGLPYACGKGGIADAVQCMSIPNYFAEINTLIQHAKDLSSQGAIDNVEFLKNDKAYVFHGTKDTTVHPFNGEKVQVMFDHFGTEVMSKFDMGATHGFPTNFYGASCGLSSAGTQYINNCAYNGAFEMFNYLYGNLIEPTSSSYITENLYEFDQTDFGSVGSLSMDTIGYIYIPTMCKTKEESCKLHMAFHGCLQARTNAGVGDAFATKTGYIQAAEENNIIVIFPQTVAMGMTNPNACFDWWGYLNANYAKKQGPQMNFLHQILSRVLRG